MWWQFTQYFPSPTANAETHSTYVLLWRQHSSWRSTWPLVHSLVCHRKIHQCPASWLGKVVAIHSPHSSLFSHTRFCYPLRKQTCWTLYFICNVYVSVEENLYLCSDYLVPSDICVVTTVETWAGDRPPLTQEQAFTVLLRLEAFQAAPLHHL